MNCFKEMLYGVFFVLQKWIKLVRKLAELNVEAQSDNMKDQFILSHMLFIIILESVI